MYVVVVADVTGLESTTLALAHLQAIIDENATREIRSIRVGIDPLDNGLKFSIDYGTWSPLIPGKIGD